MELNIIDLKEIIGQSRCIDHRTRPEIKVFGNEMTITCCCDKFHEECLELARQFNKILEIDGLVVK